MDVNDNDVDTERFFKENKDIYEFFKKHFNPLPQNITWTKNTLEGT